MIDSDAVLAQDFRNAMRRIASTVNIITICVGGEPMGIMATAMSSLAADPPSLLVCINRTATLHGSMEDVSHFCVNSLHDDQTGLAELFADRSRDAQRFSEGWEMEPDGPPRLKGAQASFLCRRIELHQFGTHSIFIGLVEDVAVRDDIAPLLYVDGRFGRVDA